MPGSQEAQMRLRVGLLDADPIRVVGFAAAFERHARLEIIPVDLAGLIADQKLSLCIVGLHGNLNLTATMQTLRGLRPDMRVLLMGPERSEQEMLKLVTGGAKAYLDETATPEQIQQAVEMVREGTVYAPLRKGQTLRQTEEVELPMAEVEIRLTTRERDVLKLLVAAQSNREIARALGIEERTVKAHVAKLMRKVGVDNRIALSVYAVQHSLFATSDALGNHPEGR